MTDAVQDISDWLIRQGLHGAGFEEIVSGFCERVVNAGVPLSRAMVSMRTLHPEIDAHSFIWKTGQPLEVEDFGMDELPAAAFLASPLYYLLTHPTETELRRRLTGPDALLDFEVFEEFRQNGLTDYLIQKVPFTVTSGQDGDTGMLCSWASRHPEGFSEDEIGTFRRLAPRLGLSISHALQREITLNVLDTYVGTDAGGRILKGEIRRGSLQEIDAAILFMDFRGFTTLSDRMDGAVMAALLNEYFELVVPEIVGRGGEILKYLGDGILATFNLERGENADICETGLMAAVAALRNVRARNAERQAAGEPVMELDIAVHLGRVQYGNVGAGNRLDFTVIGAAVNEASRLEALCDALDRHLLVSDTFARAALGCAEHLVSLGRHALRGVRGEHEVFTVEV